MLRTILAAGVCISAGAILAATVTADDISARAKKLHFSSIVVDTHDDTTQRLVSEKFDLGHRDTAGHIDIPRMREGGLGAIFFSIWIPSSVTGPVAVKRALDQIDAVREQVRKHPKDLLFATTAADIRRAHGESKIAALMGIEGGHMLDNDLGALRMYAALGVRYLTLTHSSNNDWADSSTDKAAHNGLTDFGKDVVRELNRLGVIADISHVADKTFYDVLETSRAPIIASHSSCRAICDHPRNMTDEMMKALAAKGGVIQINYYAGFLSQELRNATQANPDLVKQMEAEVEKRCGKNEACQLIEGERQMHHMMAQGKLPRVGWEKIIEHIDHAVKVAGAEHVGLGSDFDGAGMPYGMEDVTKIPQITEALLKRGYSEGDIRKILGENTLRVMEEVERVAKQMQQEGGKTAGK
jgi:membrane dipeptidase